MNDARLAIRMPRSLLAETKALAERRNMTMNNLVRRLLEAEVERERKSVGNSTFDAEQA